MATRRIEPRFVERPWGSFSLDPFFPRPSKKIGEVWFDAGPLLIKFLFTTGPLSVQVHPDDDYARIHESTAGRYGAGKTEMWHILRAEPGARIALGFDGSPSREEARRAALDGSIENLLAWQYPQAGDTYFTPARTVHALGAGLVVCEIQQTSDITYRLYDYNRGGRDLHLDKGMEVADLGPHPGKSIPRSLPGGGQMLAECGYFAAERWRLDGGQDFTPSTIVVLEGDLRSGGQAFAAGQVFQIDGAGAAVQGSATVVRTYVPAP